MSNRPHDAQDGDQSDDVPEVPHGSDIPTRLPSIEIREISADLLFDVLPRDPTIILGTDIGTLVSELADEAGKHPMMPAIILPAVVSGVLGPGYHAAVHEHLSWHERGIIWTALVAGSGAGTLL